MANLVAVLGLNAALGTVGHVVLLGFTPAGADQNWSTRPSEGEAWTEQPAGAETWTTQPPGAETWTEQ